MWLNESNRQKHALLGFVEFILVFACLNILFMPPWFAALASFECVAATALALEFKDFLYGNKFDWLDALATVLVPAIITILIFIYL